MKAHRCTPSFIIIATLVFAGHVLAQAPDTLWTTTLGGEDDERGKAIIQTVDGGCALTGFTYSSGAGWNDIWLVKTDSVGNMEWERTYGGRSNDWGSDIKQTSDHGYILSGSTKSFGAGGWDAILIRTDASGDTLWTKTYGGTGNDFARALDLTSDGGYVITGETTSFGANVWDAWIVKTDSSGNVMWDTIIDAGELDEVYSIQQTVDDGYILTGAKFRGDYVWLIKLDPCGEIEWTKSFDFDYWQCGYSVQQTFDGGYVLCGAFGNLQYDIFVIRIDQSGNILWTQTYGGDLEDRAVCIRQTGDGGFIVAAYTESYGSGMNDFWVFKLDALGVLQWSKTIGGNLDDWADHLTITSDGGYIITGITESYGAGDWDAWLVRMVTDSQAGVEERIEEIPSMVTLSQNYPNPFNTSTSIVFRIPKSNGVELAVYDLRGKQVEILARGYLKAGTHSIVWDAGDLPSGIYLCKLVIGEYRETRKLVLQR